MHLGLRPVTPFPSHRKGMCVVRTHGRIFAYPPEVEPAVADDPWLLTHPAVISASTFEELDERIAEYDRSSFIPELVETRQGWRIVRLGPTLHAVPPGTTHVDLNLPEERRRGGILSARTLEELATRIQESTSAEPVEFAGWLPVYEFTANCGKHPQFAHTDAPPHGYRFICSHPAPRKSAREPWCTRLRRSLASGVRKASLAVRPLLTMLGGGPRVGLPARLRVVRSFLRTGWQMWRSGASLRAVFQFLRSRHYQSQLLQAKHKGLTFLTSMPFTFGQGPWVIEIEDPTTLFFPMIQNGHTAALEIRKCPCYPVVKALLESEQCKAILTHMQSTAHLVPVLFESETIRKKVVYAPLGIKLPARWQKHESCSDDEPIHLLFINSWSQIPSNFYVRGGLDILEAFAILRERYPQLRLTLRTELPPLDPHYLRIVESGWVRIINRFLPAEEMAELCAGSHIFLLPAARVHIVSLLQAMSYGLAVVASDGWGMEEYLENERTGLVVKGRYGKTSWADEEEGVLRENYEPMFTPDPEVVQGIVDAVSRLVEDRQLRSRLGRTARKDVETRYNVEQWNRAMKAALDRGREDRVDCAIESIQTEELSEAVTQR